jgi:hypothetical protein
MMTKAGRLVLVKYVLMVIQLHEIVVLRLNKKALKQIEKIVRGFLWAGRASASGGHCHVNWAKVCRPLRLGGLGILDLARTTISLRLRWLWRMHIEPLRPWRDLDMQFSSIERGVFDASMMMVVHKGLGRQMVGWPGHLGYSVVSLRAHPKARSKAPHDERGYR